MKSLLSILFLFSASHGFSADFSEFVGSWRFCEKATIDLWRSEAKTDAKKEHVEKLIKFKKELQAKLNMPFYSDIEITAKSIVGVTGIVMPKYDLISLEKKPGRVSARVYFHEDKNDPGDAYESAISISIIEGKKLRLDVELEMAVSYIFENK